MTILEISDLANFTPPAPSLISFLGSDDDDSDDDDDDGGGDDNDGGGGKDDDEDNTLRS